MARSLKKGPYVDERLSAQLKDRKQGDQTGVKTWARRATITPEMVGVLFLVHTGKEFVRVLATEEMVGHKLGEFAATTKFQRHGGKMQKEMEEKAVAAAKVPAAEGTGTAKKAESKK